MTKSEKVTNSGAKLPSTVRPNDYGIEYEKTSRPTEPWTPSFGKRGGMEEVLEQAFRREVRSQLGDFPIEGPRPSEHSPEEVLGRLRKLGLLPDSTR